MFWYFEYSNKLVRLCFYALFTFLVLYYRRFTLVFYTQIMGITY